MAYDLFDDAAFYWFAVMVLILFLFMPTYRVLFPIDKDRSSIRRHLPIFKSPTSKIVKTTGCCEGCRKKVHHLKTERKSGQYKEWMTFGSVVFIGLWVLLIYLLVQMPNYMGQELLSFDPYTILDLEVGAEPSQIKRQYKKMSLKFHPDKNRDNPDAKSKFIMIAKAYETLTDDAARENWEKYGNPDGYQGKSVVIGLPSFLTDKKNEKAVLVSYLLIMLVLPPIFIALWWMKASQFHESGVRAQTLALYGSRFVAENTPLKSLIEILATSREYEVALRISRDDENAFRKLYALTEEYIMKPRLSPPGVFTYSSKGVVLLTAYLRRERIPKRFRPSLNYLLEHAHRLLDMLVEVTVARQMPNTKLLFVIFEFMQRITQATWVHEADLFQLPHIDYPNFVALNKGRKNRIQGLRQFNELESPARFENMTLNPRQIADINGVLSRMPLYLGAEYELRADLTSKATRVFREDDIIKLSIKIKRHAPELRVQEDDVVFDEKEPQQPQQQAKPEKLSRAAKKKLKEQAANEPEGTSDADAAGVDVDEPSADEPADIPAGAGGDDNDDDDEEEDEEWWIKAEKPKKNEAVVAHAPYFPFLKQERWYVLMVDAKTDRLYHFEKISSLTGEENLEIRFRAPDVGKQDFDVHIVSDSYVGLDYKTRVQLQIVPVPEEAEEEESSKRRILADDESDDEFGEGGLDGDEDFEEEEEDPKWYYLYLASTLGEFILTLGALGFLFMIVFSFLVSRGYWDAWVVPRYEAFLTALRPYLKQYLKLDL